MKKTPLNWILGVLCFLSSSTIAQEEQSSDYFFFSPQVVSAYLKEYSDEEKEAIEKDLNVVRSVCFSKVQASWSGKPLYVATAGAPGARKTTILERFLDKHPLQSRLLYLDPDQRTLKFMAHTYYSQSLAALTNARHERYVLAVKEAYDKWCGASNYIAYTLLEEGFSRRMNIAQGTTSTGEHVPNFLAKIKDADYKIVLLLCSCEDAFRHQAIQYRNEVQTFYQSTPEHALSKGKLFPQRMSAYFTYADTLYLFWSDDLSTQERLAAILEEGDVQVLDQDAFNQFIGKFEADRNRLNAEGKGIPSWSQLVQLYHSRF
ncbi:MAG: zeta toxin family protein [Simkania sp.]|nr:zeta toxin family protein [Simkania sp.]